MKRSESMLVYGVTAILLVIVGVAVIFGENGQVNSQEPQQDELVDFFDDPQSGGSGEFIDPTQDSQGEQQAPDGEGVEGEGGESEVVEPAPEPVIVITQVMNYAPNRVIQTWDGQYYRQVDVTAGHSFEDLCVVYAPGHDPDEIHLLNESVDRDNVLPGTSLLMPFVEEETILASAQERRSVGPASRRSSRDQGGVVDPGPIDNSTARSTHTVQPGDSLWAIAKGIVGANSAEAYAEQIRQANNLPSNTIRPGMTLTLPPHGE
ncbi:MAG: LysM peptidoglycan-binding domain-containing protein [Planctomycetota bacterium]